MQVKPKLPSIPSKSEDIKRTTIILERSEREFIEYLISEGKEPGIRPLISKMLEIYKCLNVDDWRFPGEYYCGISRIAFVNVELINILTMYIPKEKWVEVGTLIGDALRVSIQSTLGVDASKQENWLTVFNRLKVQGFGDLNLKDKFILLKSPFINECAIWRGILQGLLCVDLEVRNMVPPMVFEIKKLRSTTV
jgi:hypothetical protein